MRDEDPVFTRREMLGMTGMAGLAALTGTASGAVAQTAHKRPRIACLVSYWGATRSHADWIVTKLLDGYWWQGTHTPSRVDVVSVYIHQLEESGLGQKICKSKGIPVFKDKHLSYSWDEARWMFDKSRELKFPLTGGSSIPIYFRKPEIELDIETPIRNSIVLAGAGDEGAIFH